MGSVREPWPPGGRELFRAQLGVARRDQLRAVGVDSDVVRVNVRAGRWTTLGPSVVVMDNGRLDLEQLRWVAVLHFGGSAALCAWTSLQASGMHGFERPDIHVVVPRGAVVTRTPRLPATRVAGLRTGRTGRSVAGIARPVIVLHESRRHCSGDVVLRRGVPPSHAPARAAVDAGAWAPTHRAAAGVLLASVQQRLTTPDALLVALEAAGRIRRRRLMVAVVADAAGGVGALSEMDFALLCRQASLPEPHRQQPRQDGEGRWRYLDVIWTRRDGRGVHVEVDGRGHMEVEVWEEDLLRANDIAIADGAIVLRVPATVVRTEAHRVMVQVRRALGL